MALVVSEGSMYFHRRASRALLAAAFVALAVPSSAQPAQAVAAEQAIRSEIDQLRQDCNARLAALESRLATLEGGTAGAASTPSSPGAAPTAQVPSGAEGSGGPSGALPVYGNAVAGAKVFNPDMAVIGNFLGAAGKSSVNPLPALALPESELSLQAIVDPYARADFFFSFGEEGVAVEEGYLTFPTLPGGSTRHSARPTRCTRTCCHGPTVRWSWGTWSAGKSPWQMRAFRLPG